MKKQVTWVAFLLCLFLSAACEKPVLESNDDVKKINNVPHKLTRVVHIYPKELTVKNRS